MKLQKAPLSHTCLATAFAMVLDTDVLNLINTIGADPHQILWPQHEEPQCFRGHHIQELIDDCWREGYSVTEIQARPRFGTLGCTATFEVWDKGAEMCRIEKYLKYTGVITSPTHAVVEWSIQQKIKIDAEPVDVAVSLNDMWIFVLNDKGEVLVYSKSGKLEEKIPVGKDFDQIRVGPRDNILYLNSRKNKTVEIVALDFIQNINITGAPFKGPVDAPVVIAVFTDFE